MACLVGPAAAMAGLAQLPVPLRQLGAALGFYLSIELWRAWRFRRLLRRLKVRRYTHRGHTDFLAFAKRVLLSETAPVTLDAEVFNRFNEEDGSPSVGYGGGRLDWQRVYAWWAWGCGRPFDAPYDAELHRDLLACAGACCRSLGVAPPPAGAPPPMVPAPSPFGCSGHLSNATSCLTKDFFRSGETRIKQMRPHAVVE